MRRRKSLWIVAVTAWLFTACAAPPEHFSPDYGRSYGEAFSAQVQHPEAPRSADTPDELPGEAADGIYREKYLKSLLEQPKEGSTVSGELQDQQ